MRLEPLACGGLDVREEVKANGPASQNGAAAQSSFFNPSKDNAWTLKKPSVQTLRGVQPLPRAKA
jgi:hypothetical protein